MSGRQDKANTVLKLSHFRKSPDGQANSFSERIVRSVQGLRADSTGRCLVSLRLTQHEEHARNTVVRPTSCDCVNFNGADQPARSGTVQRRQRPADLGLNQMLAIIRRGVMVRQALSLFAGERCGRCDVFSR